MFYEMFAPVLVFYPVRAKGWQNGVYQERIEEKAETTWDAVEMEALVQRTEELLGIKNRMWTETEPTGFGVFRYVEGIALRYPTGAVDGIWKIVFSNPTKKEIIVSVLANDIVKVDSQKIPAGQSVEVSFTLCSIEETTVLTFFNPADATQREAAEADTVYIRDITYHELAKRTAGEKKTLFIASDSTAQSYEACYSPQAGWGQMLPQFFSRDISIENHAIGGRSSRSFISEGRWDALLSRANPGDYCLIQWAHNDATAARPNRYVPVEEFEFYLEKYIRSCRARKIYPILVTPVSRRNCEEHGGEFPISFGEYREVIRTLGQKEHVPVVDLGKKSNELLRKIGAEDSKKLYLWCASGAYPDGAYADGVSDNTHLQEYGASVYAKMVAKELAALPFPETKALSPYIR